MLVILKHLCYYVFCLGGVAQLGERLNGIQEVMGSIPTVSTKTAPFIFEGRCFYILFGPVAQLGERTVRIRKVEGSIPFGSTKKEVTFVYQKLLLFLSNPQAWLVITA